MIDFEMDDNGDLVVFNDLATVSGVEQLKQSVNLILTTQLGEFLLEPAFGMTRSNLFARVLNTSFIQSDISDALLTWNKLINSVENFGFSQDRATRQLNVMFDLFTDKSDDEINMEVGLNA